MSNDIYKEVVALTISLPTLRNLEVVVAKVYQHYREHDYYFGTSFTSFSEYFEKAKDNTDAFRDYLMAEDEDFVTNTLNIRHEGWRNFIFKLIAYYRFCQLPQNIDIASDCFREVNYFVASINTFQSSGATRYFRKEDIVGEFEAVPGSLKKDEKNFFNLMLPEDKNLLMLLCDNGICLGFYQYKGKSFLPVIFNSFV